MTRTDKELLAIAKRRRGKLSPAAVLEVAKDPTNYLHRKFTWDDTKAARKWRIYEAQKLIRDCRITIDNNGVKETTFAFVGLSTDRNGPSASNPYRLASDVAAAEDLISIAISDAVVQLRAVKSRYEHLSKLQGVWDAIDAVSV